MPASVGQPPYIPQHMSIDAPTQMVPTAQVAYEPILVVDDQ